MEWCMKSLKLKSRHWIVNEKGEVVFGEGRKSIFEHIENTGSMYQTARIMKMSYKGVWSKIKASEEAMNVILVEKIGTKGSRLTKEGKSLLSAYNRLQERCLTSDDDIFESLFH